MWFGHIRSINRNVWITKTHCCTCTCMLHMTCRIEQSYFLFHTTQLNPMWPNHVYSSSHTSRIFACSPGECCRMETILLFPATLLICVLLCCWSQRFGIFLWAKHIAILTHEGSYYCWRLQHFRYEMCCWIKHPVLVYTWLIKQIICRFLSENS